MFNNLCGYREDRVAIQQAAAQFGSLGQVAPNLLGGAQKNVYLWRPLLQVKPSWRRGAQAIGDCCLAGSKVTLSDDKTAPIESIIVGDIVISGKGIPRKVIRTIHKPSQTHNMVEVSTGNGHALHLTHDHQLEAEIGTDRYSWVAVGMLKPGQKLRHYVSGKLIEKPVLSLREYREECEVFCLEVDEDHSFIVEGIVSKNCTSWGMELAATTLMATQDRLGGGQFVAEAATEPLYGGARVECAGGKPGGSRPAGSQDGAVPAWCALFVKEYGVTLRLDYSRETGNPEHDLRVYSGKKAKNWGNSGCGGANDGGKLDTVAKEHPINHIAQVRNVTEAIASLNNGYAFTMGSQAGFGQMRRDDNGICRWVDTWGHQMCLKPTAKILGKTVKDIKDVKVGDEVLSSDGKYHKVTQLFQHHFNGNMVRIKPTCSDAIEMTPTHPVLVYRRINLIATSITLEQDITELPEKYTATDGRVYRPIWVPACEVLIGDHLVSPGLASQTSWDIEVPVVQSPRAFKPILSPKLNAELAYFFGFYVGDGNIKKNHGIQLTLSLKDDVTRLCDAIRQFGVEPRVRRFNRFVRITADSVTLARSFAEWFGKHSYTKRFPSWLCDSRYLEEVVAGYCDADGCLYKGRVQVVTTSATLVQQLRLMLVTLGHVPNFYSHDNTGGTYANSAPTWMGVWWPDSDKSCVKHIGHVNLHKVKSVLLLPYNGPVHNFEVSDTHDYVADGFVSHNCTFGLRWRLGKPEFRICQSWGDVVSGPDPDILETISDIWKPDARAMTMMQAGQPMFIKPNLPWENFPALADMRAASWNPISATSWWCIEQDMARILSSGDCWTYSDVQGFKKRDLDIVKAAGTWVSG